MSNAAAAAGFRLADVPMAFDRSEGWDALRAAGDVFEAEGTWYLTSLDAVQFAQRHPDIFSSAKAFDLLGSPLPLIPIAVDPPDHARFRKVLDPMLAPRVINQMEDELRRQVGELVDVFAARGSCDIVADLGRLYPTQVFLTLFGLPLSDRDQFIDWAETIIEMSTANAEPTPEVLETAGALFAYLQDYVERKRRSPGDDMLSRILALTGDGAFTNEEVLGLCFLFVLAGLDTVTAAIGFAVLHLARQPELRRRVVADISLVNPFLEEILRLELPAPLTPRVTLTDVEVGGRTIPAGSRVMIAIAAANRDPSRYDHPNDINLDVAARSHFGFGGGIHRCLGSHLARRELRLVVEELHQRIPDYHIRGGFEPRVTWPSGTLHLSALPLEFDPVGSRG